MKKIIYTLIAAFVACTAVAQTPSAYFMEGSTFRSQLNPAFAPLRGYVNIPVLGGVQVNVSGNLSVSDIFYPVNGSLVTLFRQECFCGRGVGKSALEKYARNRCPDQYRRFRCIPQGS